MAVDRFENEVPREVHDRKRQQELATFRQDLVDRQVKLHQSKSQISQLRTDVALLTDSLDRRQRLLSEAYPVLEQATRDQAGQVRFANQEFSLPDFQRELDDLLARQEREEKQLAIKQQGLERLQQSEQQAEQALADMRLALEQAEQEVDVLVARRAQAEVEAQTLDMAAAVVGNSRLSDEAISGSQARLRNEVTSIETRNDARRAIAPAGTNSGGNRLARQWNRLETLKALHDRQSPQATDGPSTLETTPGQPSDAARNSGSAGEPAAASQTSPSPVPPADSAPSTTPPATAAATDFAPAGTTTLTGADVRIEIRGR